MRDPFEPPLEICKAVKTMLDQHSETIASVNELLNETQFVRYLSTAQDDVKAREEVYMSIRASQEFIGYLGYLAERAKAAQDAEIVTQQ